MNNSKTPRVMRFFREYFGYMKATKVFKDAIRVSEADIPQWNPKYLINDLERMIKAILVKNKDVISELLTSHKFVVAHPADNKYAKEIFDTEISS